MAAGDVVANITSIGAVTGILDIRPGFGSEWSIHNIYYAGGIMEFWRTDGVNKIKFDSDGTAGARLGFIFHCTNSQWIQLKNISAQPVIVGYDGIQTR